MIRKLTIYVKVCKMCLSDKQSTQGKSIIFPSQSVLYFSWSELQQLCTFMCLVLQHLKKHFLLAVLAVLCVAGDHMWYQAVTAKAFVLQKPGIVCSSLDRWEPQSVFLLSKKRCFCESKIWRGRWSERSCNMLLLYRILFWRDILHQYNWEAYLAKNN